MDVESDLFEICAQLLRDAGCKKVMVCGSEGDVLAHAGERGIFDEASADALAAMVVDVLGAQAAPTTGVRPELPGELQVSLPGGLTGCGTALLDKAALVVVFDQGTTLERVKIKMRRARDRLVKSLPGIGDKNESTPSKS
jgi:predicted regulator of Ras-like GTPase activity (Roadblock/LC7/MglB family)